jgi:hypothetical protein
LRNQPAQLKRFPLGFDELLQQSFPLGIPRLTGSRAPAPVGEFLDITSGRTNVAHESLPIVVRWCGKHWA